jgi:hypothetical protein
MHRIRESLMYSVAAAALCGRLSNMTKLTDWAEVHPWGNDFFCPNTGCRTGFTVENWRTEYSKPFDGDFEVKCPECGWELKVDIETNTTYKSRMKAHYE